VAGFIGRGTVLDVRVTAVQPGCARLHLPSAVQIESRAVDAVMGPGQVLLRPTDLRVDPDGLPARVLSGTYRGDHWETRMAVEGVMPPLLMTLPSRVPPGQTLSVRITGGWLLPGA